MKTYLALSAVLVLAACAQPAETETEEAPVEEVAAYDGSVAAGDYTVTYADGSAPFSIDPEGNWTSVDEEGNTTEGTSEIVDGKICFTATGQTEAECWTNQAPGEDGSFSSTSDAGETVTVTPAAAEAEAAT